MTDPALPQAQERVLSVVHLRVRLDGNTIIRDLSFDLFRGETLVILGPNGSGKTVLLKTLLGILPHSGEIRWRVPVKLGYVPQRVPFNKEVPLTVEDFFRLKAGCRRSSREALEQVGITESAFGRKGLGVLSSGQYQRVLIAWALSGDPDVLLIDEATAGIDIGGEQTIQDLLQNIQRKRSLTVVLVTHDLNLVHASATRVLCMNDPNPCSGTPQEVLDPTVLKALFGKEIKLYRHHHD